MIDTITYNDLEEKLKNFNLSNYQLLICKNIKRYRRELYDKYKALYKEKNLRNPYSAQAVSELLGISYEYYKRLESFDKSKPISLKLLLKVSLIFNIGIDKFFDD